MQPVELALRAGDERLRERQEKLVVFPIDVDVAGQGIDPEKCDDGREHGGAQDQDA